MPLMSNDEYNALLAVIDKLSEQNEALKEEERNIEQQLKKGQHFLKEKRAWKNAPSRSSSRQRSKTPSQPKCLPHEERNRPLTPVEQAVCPAVKSSRHRKNGSPVPNGEDAMTTCWENDWFEQPLQDICSSAPNFEDSVLARFFAFAYEEANLLAQIMDTENKIACTRNAFEAIEEGGLDDHIITPSQPTVLVGPTPDFQEKADQPTKPTAPTPTLQEEQHEALPPTPTSSMQPLRESSADPACSNSTAELNSPKIFHSQPTGLPVSTPKSEQVISSPIPTRSLHVILEAANTSMFSVVTSTMNAPSIYPIHQPIGHATSSHILQQVPETETQPESFQLRESCLDALLSTSDPNCTKSPTDFNDLNNVPNQPTEPTASTPVYQQMALPPPPPNLENTNVKICQACCSPARHRAISERKASIHEAVKEMNAIQECLNEVQEVVKNHSSFKDVLYLQESLSNVEVGILSAHFSLATAPQPDTEDDEESIVSYRTPDDIVTIWMDIDATKRRLSLLMAHAQDCTMCKDSFEPTFYRIDEELSGLAKELKRYHNQEPIKN